MLTYADVCLIGGCAKGFGKGVCGSLPQKWHEAVENMRGVYLKVVPYPYLKSLNRALIVPQ